jgi:hypothetical protein
LGLSLILHPFLFKKLMNTIISQPAYLGPHRIDAWIYTLNEEPLTSMKAGQLLGLLIEQKAAWAPEENWNPQLL